MKRFLDPVLAHPWLVLAAVLAVTAGLVAARPEPRFDASLESYFAADSPYLVRTNAILDEYGSSVPMVVAFEVDDAFDPGFLRLLRRLTRRMGEVEYVERITSLTDVDVVRGVEGGVEVEPLLEEIPTDPAALAALRRRALADPTLVGNLVSADGTVAAIVAELVYLEGQDDVYPPWVASRFREILAAEELPGVHEVHVTGMAPIFAAMKDAIQHDTGTLAALSFVFVFGGLWLAFRNVVATVLPSLVIALTGGWTIAALTLAGKPLTMASTLLPPLVFVIGMADSVHLLNQYYRARADAPPGREGRLRAVRESVRAVAVPCLMTSVTTMIGFASLRSSDLVPIRDFGLFVAFGIGVALLLTLTLLPAVLHYVGEPGRRTLDRYEEGPLGRALEAVGPFVVRRRRAILVAFVLVSAVSVAGLFRIRVETHIRESFKEGSEVLRGIEFIEGHLAGTDIIVLSLDSGAPGGAKEPAFLRFAERLERALEADPVVDRVDGLPDVVRRMNRVFHQGDPAHDAIPGARDLIAQYLLVYELGSAERLATMLSADERGLKLVARIRVVSTATARATIAKLDTLIAAETPDGVGVQVAGPVWLMSQMADRLVISQIKSFGYAFVAIFVMMLVLLRSPGLAVLSMIPNAFPIVFALGLMGWCGIALDTSTVMIASISIGIAVDDTIHYLHHLRGSYRATGDLVAAMQRTLTTTGRAIVATSLTVMGGFLVAVLSSFKPPIYFGVLSAVAVFVALIADLFLLPACILTFRPRIDGERPPPPALDRARGGRPDRPR